MARIPRNPVGNTVYHVLSRANGREKIFKTQKDYEVFMEILFEAKEKYPMRILSFCIITGILFCIQKTEKIYQTS